MLRRILDGLYTLCGYIAACFMVLILLLIVAQMAARWTGFVIPGATDYAGYCMAGASFFAYAYALNHGAHIRVTLVLGRLGRYRRYGEIWCYGIATFLSSYFAYYAIQTVHWSYKFNEISQGQDAWPIWIPQMSMAIGTLVLAIAFIDHLISIIFFGSEGVQSQAVEEATH